MSVVVLERSTTRYGTVGDGPALPMTGADPRVLAQVRR